MNLGMVLLAMLLFTSCDKKNEEETEVKEKDPVVELSYSTEQNVIIQEFTSTGCPGCGSWGIPTFEKFIDDNPTVVPIAVHIKYGDKFITTESNALGNNRVGSRFTPQISIGSEPCVVLSSGGINAAASVAKMQKEFDSLSGLDQQVKVAANYTIEDGNIIIHYGGEVLAGANGEYVLTAYVMENGNVASQIGGKSNEIHNHVIRTSTDEAFGTPLEGKKEFNKTIELDADWNWENIYVTAIVWKKNGNVFEFENAIQAEKL